MVELLKAIALFKSYAHHALVSASANKAIAQEAADLSEPKGRLSVKD
jgi:hypothetical protein